MGAIGIPLATCADRTIARLAAATESDALAKLDGATLLGERAQLAGMTIPGRTSAGGGCRLFDAVDGTLALNLSRASDREMLPALFEAEGLDSADVEAVARLIARSEVVALVRRGRSMGLAIAAEGSGTRCPPYPYEELVPGLPAPTHPRRAPRVVDLSALWAGPLAAHLLWLAGAEVVKVESRTRPDSMRDGNNTFYTLLNQGKASVALDFRNDSERQALLSLISASDIVIEASRPRALAQLGIDAAQIVRTTPGLVWVTITAHGAAGEAANWVGFGDDCGVSGGLSAALRASTGHSGFVGDAIADPLTGMWAALAAWEAWASGRGGRLGVTMSEVVAHCLASERAQNPLGIESSLMAWEAAVGRPFPTVDRRRIGPLPAFGEQTRSYLGL